MNIADELRKLADRIETPDPYAELKKAHAEGRAIEQVGHSSGDWFACGSDVAWTRPPECYRIKPEEPWTLGRELPGFRALRDGEEWHFAGKWRREWLPSGCRPLLVGEDEQYGDEAIFASGEIVEVCTTTQPDDMDLPRRTNRPLPILKASQIADGWKEHTDAGFHSEAEYGLPNFTARQEVEQ